MGVLEWTWRISTLSCVKVISASTKVGYTSLKHVWPLGEDWVLLLLESVLRISRHSGWQKGLEVWVVPENDLRLSQGIPLGTVALPAGEKGSRVTGGGRSLSCGVTACRAKQQDGEVSQ